MTSGFHTTLSTFVVFQKMSFNDAIILQPKQLQSGPELKYTFICTQ